MLPPTPAEELSNEQGEDKGESKGLEGLEEAHVSQSSCPST